MLTMKTDDGMEMNGDVTPPPLSLDVLELVRTQLELVRNSETPEDSAHDQETGLTLDLSHRKIDAIPLEVIQLIRDEVERLALSHNQLTHFDGTFSFCNKLRYLNIRSNMFKEFPTALCSISSLEILDISRNRLKSLPTSFGQLMKLKVLSVSKNKIQILPNYIGNMEELKILKVDHNPILFPPRAIVEFAEDSETDKDLWLEGLKQFLRQHAERSGMTQDIEESDSSTDGGTDIELIGDDHTSELEWQQEVPDDAHAPAPLDIESPQLTERSRSNSEGTLNRSAKRMGYVTKKSDVGPAAEDVRTVRHHVRGISYDSSVTANQRMAKTYAFDENSLFPPQPPEVNRQPEPYFRRLSALGHTGDPQRISTQLTECSRGILYAVSQIQPTIHSFARISSDTGVTCINLEKVLPAANMGIGELVKALELYDTKDDIKSVEALSNAAKACVITFRHVLGQLQVALDDLGSTGEKRYQRTLLLLAFGSFAEIMSTWTNFEPTLSAYMAKDMQDASNNQYDDPNTGPPSPSHTSIGDYPASNADEALFEKLLQTLNSTLHFITLLMDAIKRTLTSNAEGRLVTLQGSTVTRLKELNGVCIGGMEVTRRLKARMDNIREADLADRRRFAEDITRFVTSVMSIGELAKAGSTEFPFHKSVLSNFSPVARSTKEVTVLLHISSFRGLSDPNQNFNQVLPLLSPMPFPSPMGFQLLSPQMNSASTTPLSAALGPAVQAIVQTGSHKSSISNASAVPEGFSQLRTLTGMSDITLPGLDSDFGVVSDGNNSHEGSAPEDISNQQLT